MSKEATLKPARKKINATELAIRINQKLDRKEMLGEKDFCRIKAAAKLENEECQEALFRTFLILRRGKRAKTEEDIYLFLKKEGVCEKLLKMLESE